VVWFYWRQCKREEREDARNLVFGSTFLDALLLTPETDSRQQGAGEEGVCGCFLSLSVMVFLPFFLFFFLFFQIRGTDF
jgi:hypothetical protein